MCSRVGRLLSDDHGHDDDDALTDCTAVRVIATLISSQSVTGCGAEREPELCSVVPLAQQRMHPHVTRHSDPRRVHVIVCERGNGEGERESIAIGETTN